jgi:pyrroloquinoline quinone (PQQ) biosynthesis protein C
MSTPLSALVDELARHPVNTHGFFLAFRDQRLTPSQLQTWLRQYHYFCKHFVKVLEGLLYRTPVDELEMRVELSKTLYSELGDGRADQAHIRLLERFALAVGLGQTDLDRTIPITPVEEYLAVLLQVFTKEAYLVALGGELAVEVTAAAEFRYFYPGLLEYGQFSAQDLAFFAMHVEAEDDHSAWLTAAAKKTAKSDADFEQVARGARITADAWQCFWDGMYQDVFHNDAVILSKAKNL